MEALAGCNPVAYGKWFDSTVPHEEGLRRWKANRRAQKRRIRARNSIGRVAGFYPESWGIVAPRAHMIKDRKAFNEYQRQYQLRRYHERRREAIQRLGGKCVRCSSTERLELDHIDPKTKSFALAKLWAVREELFATELSKCQLLCEDCHNVKSIGDRGFRVAKGTHGTVSAYRYCHCNLCRAANTAQARIRKTRLRSSTG